MTGCYCVIEHLAGFAWRQVERGQVQDELYILDSILFGGLGTRLAFKWIWSLDAVRAIDETAMQRDCLNCWHLWNAQRF